MTTLVVTLVMGSKPGCSKDLDSDTCCSVRQPIAKFTLEILVGLICHLETTQEEQRREEEEQIRMENILTGNPLLKDKYSAAAAPGDKSDLKVKRRWDDDVVFKNCSRAEPETQDKRFINDSLRSDFHRKFMDKYIK